MAENSAEMDENDYKMPIWAAGGIVGLLLRVIRGSFVLFFFFFFLSHFFFFFYL
jgi:hypothetical protein